MGNNTMVQWLWTLICQLNIDYERHFMVYRYFELSLGFQIYSFFLAIN